MRLVFSTKIVIIILYVYFPVVPVFLVNLELTH